MTVDKNSKRKFLVIADDTVECRVALRFAARRAEKTGGRLAIMCIIAPADFQHWMAVEEKMREEAREEVEALLHTLAKQVKEISDATPELLIREGKPREQILQQLKEDPNIAVLVLGAATAPEGPGPLVSMIAGKATNAYPIPVTIVPGHLTDEEVDALT